MYSNSFKKIGISAEDTKKPANNMKGMMTTGVNVTPSCLSLTPAEMIRANP